jgi:hypothetical protein
MSFTNNPKFENYTSLHGAKNGEAWAAQYSATYSNRQNGELHIDKLNLKTVKNDQRTLFSVSYKANDQIQIDLSNRKADEHFQITFGSDNKATVQTLNADGKWVKADPPASQRALNSAKDILEHPAFAHEGEKVAKKENLAPGAMKKAIDIAARAVNVALDGVAQDINVSATQAIMPAHVSGQHFYAALRNNPSTPDNKLDVKHDAPRPHQSIKPPAMGMV